MNGENLSSIRKKNSIIPACDVRLQKFEDIVKDTHDCEKLGGYKLGFSVLVDGLPKYVETLRKYTDSVPIIYDHQKGGTDTKHTGKLFAEIMRESHVNMVILFPREEDPDVQYIWSQELLDRDIEVIIGGELTHKPATDSTEKIYIVGAQQGVTNFAVPATKPERIGYYRNKLVEHHVDDPSLFIIGIGPGQGGNIKDVKPFAGNRWYPIIGRAITESVDYRRALEGFAMQL